MTDSEPHVDFPIGTLSGTVKHKRRGRPPFLYSQSSRGSVTDHTPGGAPSKGSLTTPTLTGPVGHRNVLDNMLSSPTNLNADTGRSPLVPRIIFESQENRALIAELSVWDPSRDSNNEDLRLNALAEPVAHMPVKSGFLSRVQIGERRDPRYRSVEIGVLDNPSLF